MKDLEAEVSLDEEIFTEESYKEFQKRQSPLSNDRLRDENETIFDALLSEEADFSKGPNSKLIISTVRNYKGRK